MPCFECLGEFEPDEKRVVCTTNEDGVIHGVFYPKGTKVEAHQRCLVPAEA